MRTTDYVDRQKRRYMARLLESFEADIEPHVPRHLAEKFKGEVREKLTALAKDSIDMLNLQPGDAVNGYSLELIEETTPAKI